VASTPRLDETEAPNRIALPASGLIITRHSNFKQAFQAGRRTFGRSQQ
jgi:hypothetical protein